MERFSCERTRICTRLGKSNFETMYSMDNLLRLLHSDGADELRLHVGTPPVIVLRRRASFAKRSKHKGKERSSSARHGRVHLSFGEIEEIIAGACRMDAQHRIEG